MMILNKITLKKFGKTHTNFMNKLLFLVLALAIGFIKADYKTDPILIMSIPKCGTHLLARCLALMTVRPVANLSVIGSGPQDIALDKIPAMPNHEILLDHIPYSPEASAVIKKRGIKAFFIYRDPRDQVVSMTHWVLSKPEYYQQFNKLHNKPNSFPIVLSALIKDVYKQYEPFLLWLQDPSVISVKYEDLVGPKGGGSAEIQEQKIFAFAERLQMPIGTKRFDWVINEMYGKSGTFREGKIGGWRSLFTDEIKLHFKKSAGKLLITLGYEKDLSW
jgi:sulfotransferase 6B1